MEAKPPDKPPERNYRSGAVRQQDVTASPNKCQAHAQQYAIFRLQLCHLLRAHCSSPGFALFLDGTF